MTANTRLEEDFLGRLNVEADVYYGINTARAADNFYLTGKRIPNEMIKALAENGGVIQICLLSEYVKDPDTTTVRYQKEKELRVLWGKSDSMTDEEKKDLRNQWRNLGEKYPKKIATVSDYVDHIDYVKNLVGVDYVGIGSDFDGGGGLEDCTDVSQMPNITREMLARGYTPKEINKVWGGNFFRVFKEVEKMSDSN